MNEGKLNRYSLEQAENEADRMETKLKFGKANSYQQAEEQVRIDIKERIKENLIKPATDEKRADYFFTSKNTINYAEATSLSQDLIEEIHLARITYMLHKLKAAYSDYIKDPSETKKDILCRMVAGHDLNEVYFTTQKSHEYKDVAEAFLECGAWRDASFGTDETNGSNQHILAIEELLNKYSTDERFNIDPFELKLDIAKKLSDLAKS